MDETRAGELVLVATPLGNLGDLSSRAIELFRSANVVYCEDTRRSKVLFSANDIPTGGRLESLHEHNEVAQSTKIVERVRSGELVVLITDAGTPGISDPGTRAVEAVVAAGLRVSTAPGPSAVVAALSISGLPTDRFVMEGFMPRKAGERAQRYAEWAREVRTIVFYESPQRVSATLVELAGVLPERRVAVVRELTKIHEEVIRGTVADVAALLEARDVLGEIVVVLAGASEASAPVSDKVIVAALFEQWDDGSTTRDAVEYVAEALGVSRRDVYRLALEARRE
ncbi:MAG TPA: 16S rRNA (cytidine(1402)-2'-O)-methyltransferase [Acidimicrobiales bacterium]|jgi:16S rRNA (cytidine1402-2'-O)-methyltransferase|nr:16S rRNA (cytidine(1402)-2'-O)-methyltransferase [Acidimicrobiales bacterium]